MFSVPLKFFLSGPNRVDLIFLQHQEPAEPDGTEEEFVIQEFILVL